MKKFAFLILFFGIEAYPQSREVSLSAKESLKVICPSGTALEVSGNAIKCVCPVNTQPRFDGDILKCDVVCDIKVEVIKTDDEICDQGGCFPTRAETYNAMVLRRRGGEAYYSERIYSPRSSEFNMLLEEALISAPKKCDVTFYSGKTVQPKH